MSLERYITAIKAKNLRDDRYHHACEPLAASAMTKGIGHLLHRVKYGNDLSCLKQLINEWQDIVAKKAGLRNWPKELNTQTIALISIAHFMDDVCGTCKGSGEVYGVLLDGNKLGRGIAKAPCGPCCGSGKESVEHIVVPDKAMKKYVIDMIETLYQVSRDTNAQVKSRLKSPKEDISTVF